jgi:hypothetical protein
MSAISPKHQYSVAGANTITVAIDPGDCVIVLVTTQNSSFVAGFGDNAAGGSNPYVLLNQNSNCGYTSCYYCLRATKSATQISFTSTSSEVIIVATYSVPSGYGISLGANANSGSSGGGGSSISSGSITTQQVNSYLVTMMSWWNSGSGVSITSSSGTIEKAQQPSVVSGVVCGMAVVDQATTAVAGYTNSVNTSGGNAQYQGTWTLELVAGSVSSYAGKIPPLMEEKIKYSLVPTFGGSSGGPVTPVPIGPVLQNGTIGVAYSETITAQGGSGTGYTYALTGGALPTGTSLNSSTGVISGTPTTAGTYSFTIKVTDSLGNVGSQGFSITIAAPSASGGGSWTFLN